MSNNIIGFDGSMYATGNISANTNLSINNIPVMNNTSLYSGIVNSNLTSLGTILNFKANSATMSTVNITSASVGSLSVGSSGTWTPSWSGVKGTITDASNATSNYTKIGNIVSFNYNTGTCSSIISGTSGNVYFNLPYTAANCGSFLACNSNTSNISYGSGIGLINKNTAFPPTFIINQTSGIIYSGSYLSNS